MMQRPEERFDKLARLLNGVTTEDSVKLLAFALAAIALTIETDDPEYTAIDLVCDAVRAGYSFLIDAEDSIH